MPDLPKRADVVDVLATDRAPVPGPKAGGEAIAPPMDPAEFPVPEVRERQPGDDIQPEDFESQDG